MFKRDGKQIRKTFEGTFVSIGLKLTNHINDHGGEYGTHKISGTIKQVVWSLQGELPTQLKMSISSDRHVQN